MKEKRIIIANIVVIGTIAISLLVTYHLSIPAWLDPFYVEFAVEIECMALIVLTTWSAAFTGPVCKKYKEYIKENNIRSYLWIYHYIVASAVVVGGIYALYNIVGLFVDILSGNAGWC